MSGWEINLNNPAISDYLLGYLDFAFLIEYLLNEQIVPNTNLNASYNASENTTENLDRAILINQGVSNTCQKSCPDANVSTRVEESLPALLMKS